MKTLLPILALLFIVLMCAGSSILYLNMDYGTSALLTALSVLGISLWIGYRTKQEETE